MSVVVDQTLKETVPFFEFFTEGETVELDKNSFDDKRIEIERC